ncbi:hypothetical protein CK203_086313 [Vitis vinifera]|uniref:Uncharacterized protein n=1 Tax=Vitis vinifera TaxID=29760 RepID=A0A438DBB4_VITVI|nr:hypothetical protein CK203_086313 [Vitis vinifera]
MAPKKTVSSVRVSEASEKAIDKLNAKEFRERFLIPHDVLIDLVNEEAAMPTEKGGKNAILFTKEQFNAGLRFPLPALFKEFLHFSQIPPSYSPNLVRVLMGCSIINMLYSLDLRYWKTARFDKGRGEGAGGSLGWMGGAIAASVEAFFSELYLKIPGLELRGHLVDWVEKAPLPVKLKRLTLKGGESSWRIEIRKRLKALSGRLPDRSGVRTPSEENFRKKGKLVKKHGKDAKEPTPPKEFPPPQTTYEGEVMIEEPVNAAPHSISSGPGRMSGLNHSAETAPLEEAGAESQSQPSDDPDRLAIVLVKGPPLKKPRLTRDLQSGLFERLQERQQEIEISCASAHDAHPDGGEVEMATETSAVPAIIPAEDASGPMCPDENMGAPIPGHELPSPSSSEEESADDAAPLALSATRSWKLS